MNKLMIDLDTCTDKRDDILDLVRKTYGYDRVLPMSTYTTEGSASAVQTACRGLKIPTSETMNISNSLTDDSLEDQYYGNPKKGIKANTNFKNMVDEHEGLFDLILSYDGLIKGRSQHASGVVVFNDGYINEGNAMMKTTKGVEVTAYNADDTEYMGGLKIDLLSTDALTRVQTTMELLLEHNIIEWQGSLRETYNKYLHPDVLDADNQGKYDLLYAGEVISAFQFSTDVGAQAIRKVKARSFDDLTVANSLMRLSVKGQEQPIDKYVRFRDDISLWYKEMEDNGLVQEEIELLKSHLGSKNGICDTQELLMTLVMEVGGYDLTAANKFRKLVARADKKALKKEKARFLRKGTDHGSRKELLEYVWEYCFKHQFSYAFSAPHIKGYTLVTVQEMALAYRYSPLYWQTACLIVDSGGRETDGQKDYGKIARATNSLRGKVKSPDINKSQESFTPVPERNEIAFGLYPIKGLSKKTLNTILELRPFKSFADFYERAIDTKLVTHKQAVILVKSGAFNALENKSSWDIMIDLVNRITPKKDLTLVHFKKTYESGIINSDYKEHMFLYRMRKELRQDKYIVKDKDYRDYLIDIEEIPIEVTSKGQYRVDKAAFERYYDTEIDTVRNLLKSDRITDQYQALEKREFWIEECLGTPESWEMEVVGFYSDKHELDYYPIDQIGFNDLENGEKATLFGTVIDNNKDKSIFYLSTLNGVATVKTYSNIYNSLNEVIDNGKKGKDRTVYDPSWFDRGTILTVEGRKDGNNMFTSKIAKVFGVDKGRIQVTYSKARRSDII